MSSPVVNDIISGVRDIIGDVLTTAVVDDTTIERHMWNALPRVSTDVGTTYSGSGTGDARTVSPEASGTAAQYIIELATAIRVLNRPWGSTIWYVKESAEDIYGSGNTASERLVSAREADSELTFRTKAGQKLDAITQIRQLNRDIKDFRASVKEEYKDVIAKYNMTRSYASVMGQNYEIDTSGVVLDV